MATTDDVPQLFVCENLSEKELRLVKQAYDAGITQGRLVERLASTAARLDAIHNRERLQASVADAATVTSQRDRGRPVRLLRRVRYTCPDCGVVSARLVRTIDWSDGLGYAHEAMTPSGLHQVYRSTAACLVPK